MAKASGEPASALNRMPMKRENEKDPARNRAGSFEILGGRDLLHDPVVLVELVELDGIATEEAVCLVVIEAGLGSHALGDLFGVRESRIGMRLVDLESQTIDSDDITVFHGSFVVEDAVPNVLLHVGGWRLLELGTKTGRVEQTLFPQLVGTLKDVGKPTGLTFGVRNTQIREAFEDATEDVIEQRAHRVLEREC